MNIETLLHEEISEKLISLSNKGAGTDEYTKSVNDVTELMDRLIEIRKLESEEKEKVIARETETKLKYAQMEVDKKDRFVKNALTAVSIGAPLVVGVIMSFSSMNFEKEGTFTTEAGRSTLRQLLRFK